MHLPRGLSAPIVASLLVFLLPVVPQDAQNDDSQLDSSPDILSPEKIRFSCSGRPAGFYADFPSDCKIYHMCDEAGRRFSHACPARTRFQQRTKVCDHWYMVECDEDTHASASATAPQSSSGRPEAARVPKRHSQRVNASFPYSRRNEGVPRSSTKRTPIPTERFKISALPENTSNNEKETASTLSTTTIPSTRSPPVVQASARSPALVQTIPQPSRNLQTPSLLPLQSSSPVLPTITTPASTQQFETQTENVFLGTDGPSRFTFTPSQFQGGFSASSFNNPTGIISQVKYVSPQREAKALVGLGLQPPAPSPAFSTPSPVLRQFSGNPFLESYLKSSFSISSTSTEQSGTPLTNFTAISSGEEEIGENRIEIVIPDPRKMFYIPDAKYDPGDVAKGHSTVLVIDLPAKNMKFQKVNQLEARNHDCPQCHPSFLLPGLCTPCVVIK